MNKYESYKDSDIEWIGEIPSHWEVKRLKFIADVNPSNIDKKSKEGEKEILLCNYMDVYKNDFITKEIDFMQATASDSQIEKFLLKKGDVIATKDSETADDIGVPALVNEDFKNVVCGYHLTHIKPKIIIGEYLFRQFQSDFIKRKFEIFSNGVTRYALGVDDFDSLQILLPPIREQTAIAQYLDRKTAQIDDLISDKQRLLELYEEEKTAIINHSVTKGLDPDVPMKDSGIEWLGEIPEHWEVKRFDALFSFSRGLPITKTNLQDTGVPCLSYGEIHSKYGFEVDPNSHSLRCVKEEYQETGKKSLLEYGDFVFADTSEDIEGSGNFTYLNSDVQTFAGYHTIIAKPKSNFESRYVAYFFNSLGFRNQIRCSVTGTKVYSITQSILKFTNIALPPIGDQKKIVVFIDSEFVRINKQIERTQKLIGLLKEYREALISEVVTGKVKVID